LGRHRRRHRQLDRTSGAQWFVESLAGWVWNDAHGFVLSDDHDSGGRRFRDGSASGCASTQLRRPRPHSLIGLQVQIRNSSNTVLATLATYSNLNANSTYVLKTFDLSAYRGQTIRVYFLGTEDSSLQTSFVIDDTAVNTQ
jgi:hypothetical protein